MFGLSATLLQPAPPVSAQCPDDNPQSPFDANNNPVYLQVCHQLGPGGPCPTPNAPTVVSGAGLPQEIQLSATVPSDRDATRVYWSASYQTSTGIWRDLWLGGKHVSTQDAPYAAGETVTFGVPGLYEDGTLHRFKVAFCNASNCTCWSPETEYDGSGSFTTTGPTTPSGQSRFVEDTFTRRTTDPKCSEDPQATPGDGLGPLGVWLDCQSQSGHAAWVDEICDGSGQNCMTGARPTTTSGFTYTKLLATDAKSYVEGKVRASLFGQFPSAFNFQAEAWAQPGMFNGSPVTKTYAVKLTQGVRNCSTPTLFLVKLPDEYNWAACGQGNPGYQLPEHGNVWKECSEVPPLAVEDPAYPGWSEPVWVRIEMDRTNDNPPLPLIKGWVAWGCDDGEDIDLCDHKCYHERIDSNPIPDLSGDNDGGWRMSFHEKDYFVEIFRAGALSAQPF